MNPQVLEATLRQAIQLFQSGRVAEAETGARQVLAQAPSDFNALHLLGIIHLQRNQLVEGIDLLGMALKVKPKQVPVMFERGRALSALGRFDEALKQFDKALAIEPTNAELHNARGIMLSRLRRTKEALTAFKRAVNLNPKHASARNNMGNELLAVKQYDEALACFELAIGLQPDSANIFNGMGNAYMYLFRYQGALDSYDRAIALLPVFSQAYNGRGMALFFLKRIADALACFDRAIEIDDAYLDAWHNRGRMQILLGNYAEALVSYEKAIVINPGQADFYAGQGKSLAKLNRHLDAVVSYERGIALQPDHADCYMGLAETLRDLGRYVEALDSYKKAVALHPEQTELLSGLLFTLNYVSHVDSAEVFEWHKKYGERLERPFKGKCQAHPNSTDPDKPLRIGFVSGDLKKHPVGFFMEGVFKSLHQTGLTLYAYANQPKDDELTERIRPCFSGWRDIHGLPDDKAEAMIREDGIDILVDLSGHTAHHRLPLFAQKPAPVQVTYLGYSGTTGLAAMDYIVGNRWLMPEGESSQYTEAPYRLPDTQICFTPPILDMPVAPTPALANGYVTFGNFNNLAKMNDATVACWARILKSVPDSKLLVKAIQFAGEDVSASVRARFAAHGIGVERLVLLEYAASFADHMASYNRVDIALDPFPYNGTTTTMDALWMGVPVLTLQGDRYVSRVGASIMQVMNMPEWLALDEDDLVSRAVAKAADIQGLVELRSGLRERFLASPLCDAPRFASNLSDAFRGMWRAWCGTDCAH